MKKLLILGMTGKVLYKMLFSSEDIWKPEINFELDSSQIYKFDIEDEIRKIKYKKITALINESSYFCRALHRFCGYFCAF
jgi:hypothetical protein